MASRKLLNLIISLISVSLIAGCGTTSRVAQRRQAQPDDALAPAVVHESISSADVEALHARKRKKAELSPLEQQLQALLTDTLLETSQLGLHIVDLTSGQVLASYGARQRLRPASTEKVVTAIAAIDRLGPAFQLQTQLLTTAAVSGSVVQGDVYVKGAMDPLLTVADVRSLAAQLRSAGINRISGRLIADASQKDSDELGWGWCWDDENPTLTPLLCGGKPGLADQLVAALRANGIAVARGLSVGTAPASARVLATVARPLTAVLQPMMKESDNLCAEAVFYQLGRTRKQVAAIVADVIVRAYAEFPLAGSGPGASTIADGSGLSLYNYQTPETFTRLLSYAASRPEQILTPLMQALPIAAVDGTLKKRMAGTTAEANVRAKTGSVSAVSSLVGYTTQRSTGHLIAFAIMNQGVRTMAEARNFQDRVCAAISE